MLGLKLNHVSKRGHRHQAITWIDVDPMISVSPYGITKPQLVNEVHFHKLSIDIIAMMTYNDDKSTLVQVMAGFHLAPCHCLKQC